MAQYRQQSVADRLPVRIHQDLADRIPHRPARIRRPAKPHRRPAVAAAVTATLAVVLLVSFAASHRFVAPLREGTGGEFDDDEDSRSDLEFRLRSNSSARSKELRFGSGSGRIGGDSRYWDKDDRRRDEEYKEADSGKEREGTGRDRILKGDGDEKGRILEGEVAGQRGSGRSDGNLDDEGGRAELDSYGDNPDDEYDDGIDAQDERGEGLSEDDQKRKLEESEEGDSDKDAFLDEEEKVSNEKGGGGGGGEGDGGGKKQAHGSGTVKNSSSGKKSSSKRKPKHHRFSSSSCEMKFLNSTAQIVEPLQNKKFARFSLHYTDVEERPNVPANWEPRFAGHQSLEEREESFYARDQKINCGFVKSPSGSPSTGFDIDKDDMKFLGSCHIAVSSCIFGNSDRLRTPFGKTITRLSRKNVCFVMFMDDVTLRTLLSEGQSIDNMGFMGLWKIVVVKNLPYTDMRRVGKVPKFLAHRLFPSARYSIWLDSKLRLQSDPYLILEYFLWRRGYEYAISNHYDRHCVWDEVLQNKKLNKYNHTVIDQQFEFYQSDGLKKFDPSDPNKLLPSYVPEGSFIVREHTPMSNLFSCLWFNEVERFTPRDQLSFAYTFLKLGRMNPDKHFHLNMFKDCERRTITKLFHHRAEEKRNSRAETVT